MVEVNFAHFDSSKRNRRTELHTKSKKPAGYPILFRFVIRRSTGPPVSPFWPGRQYTNLTSQPQETVQHPRQSICRATGNWSRLALL